MQRRQRVLLQNLQQAHDVRARADSRNTAVLEYAQRPVRCRRQGHVHEELGRRRVLRRRSIL